MIIMGMVIAAAFMVFGGRVLTLTHAVFLWSIYNRNQDILEGGDNFARIALLFMILTVSNAYFAPFAKRRRASLAAGQATQRRHLAVLLHNIGSCLIVFQVAVIYFVAGYLKLTSTVWNDGVAMYYVSHIHEFDMISSYAGLMSNAYIGWAVSMFTIVFEIAVPFIIFTHRAWIRKAVTVSLEGMHLGIMACMGLVAFGLIMIGADSILLTDRDYHGLRASAAAAYARMRNREGVQVRRFIAPEPAAADQAQEAGGLICATDTFSPRRSDAAQSSAPSSVSPYGP